MVLLCAPFDAFICPLSERELPLGSVDRPGSRYIKIATAGALLLFAVAALFMGIVLALHNAKDASQAEDAMLVQIRADTSAIGSVAAQQVPWPRLSAYRLSPRADALSSSGF